MELGLRCMAATGAQQVMTCLNSPAGRFSFDQPGSGAAAATQSRMGTMGSSTTASFEAYLTGVQQTGFAPLQLPLFCAHQMGTCRLGKRRIALAGSRRSVGCCGWVGLAVACSGQSGLTAPAPLMHLLLLLCRRRPKDICAGPTRRVLGGALYKQQS